MTRPSDKRLLLSKVNAVPRGLQDLLGNVNQGVNPHDLDHKISPGVDLYPFWSVNRLSHEFAFGSIAATVGQYVAIPVPEGELWQVVGASCSFDSTAGGTNKTSISLAILPPSLSGSVACFTNTILNVPGGVNQHLTAGGLFGDRFVLSGGWNIIGQVEGSSDTTARTMSVSALYIKLTE